MLKLEDFVAETLRQIINGVMKAQEFAGGNNAEVNPRNLSANKSNVAVVQTAIYWDTETFRPFQTISFDVAISASSGEKSKGGVGVFVFGIGAGAKGEADSKTESSNRIRFSVPVSFPIQP